MEAILRCKYIIFFLVQLNTILGEGDLSLSRYFNKGFRKRIKLEEDLRSCNCF